MCYFIHVLFPLILFSKTLLCSCCAQYFWEQIQAVSVFLKTARLTWNQLQLLTRIRPEIHDMPCSDVRCKVQSAYILRLAHTRAYIFTSAAQFCSTDY